MQALAAVLSFIVPLVIGVLTHHTVWGSVAALAALAAHGSDTGESQYIFQRRLVCAVIGGCMATLLGAIFACMPAASFLIPIVYALLGVLGGISRESARMCAQCIIFSSIVANLDLTDISPLSLVVLYFLGALWTTALILILIPSRIRQDPAASEQRLVNYRRRIPQWLSNLNTWQAWQYSIRIGLCTAVAESMKQIWHSGHTYWILLTIVIVVHRRLAEALKKTTQRMCGTVLGVICSAPVVLYLHHELFKVGVLAILAGLRPYYKDKNYLAYSAIMSPLVLLLLATNQANTWNTIADRLIATLIGCVISFLLGYWVWLKLVPSTLEKPAP